VRIRNLGKTIDQLIKVDPNLEDQLKPIKNKSSRWPAKNEDYWKELLEFLNSEDLKNHPKRSEMHEIFVTKRNNKSPLYSFEPVLPRDLCVGAIPEDIADIVRRHDLKSIRIAKIHVEANMTRNVALLKKVAREEFLLGINSEKIWVKLCDHFNLWDKPIHYTIKSRDGILFLVEASPHPQFIGDGLVKMDSRTLKEFFKFMKIDPPQGLFGD